MPRRIQSNNLPDPEVLAQEIVEDLEAALEQFCEIATDLSADVLTDKGSISALLQLHPEVKWDLLDSPSPCDICAVVSLPHH
jgi:hypothetical protein